MRDEAQFIESLRTDSSSLKKRAASREKCLSFLTENPNSLRVRVFLSRLYFEDSYNDFAIRELLEVKKQIDNPLVDRILKELGVGVEAKKSGDKVIAEVKS